MTRRLRSAGARWRLLVHEPQGRSFSVTSDPDAAKKDAALTARLGLGTQTKGITILAGTEFDEVVAGSFLHAEQMNTGQWWINIGGVHLTVHVDRDGRATSVFSEGVVDPRAGCTYELGGGWE